VSTAGERIIEGLWDEALGSGVNIVTEYNSSQARDENRRGSRSGSGSGNGNGNGNGNGDRDGDGDGDGDGSQWGGEGEHRC
jgi:hypothetical protein